MQQLEEPPALLRQKPERLVTLPRRSTRPNSGALPFLLSLQLLTTACHAQLASDAQKCEKNVNNNPDLALQGCTAVIMSGQLSEVDLAKVLNDRGLAYSNKGKYDQAIQDYDKAIALKPEIPEAFNNRGLAYEQKGDYDHAVQDYDRAI